MEDNNLVLFETSFIRCF